MNNFSSRWPRVKNPQDNPSRPKQIIHPLFREEMQKVKIKDKKEHAQEKPIHDPIHRAIHPEVDLKAMVYLFP